MVNLMVNSHSDALVSLLYSIPHQDPQGPLSVLSSDGECSYRCEIDGDEVFPQGKPGRALLRFLIVNARRGSSLGSLVFSSSIPGAGNQPKKLSDYAAGFLRMRVRVEERGDSFIFADDGEFSAAFVEAAKGVGAWVEDEDLWGYLYKLSPLAQDFFVWSQSVLENYPSGKRVSWDELHQVLGGQLSSVHSFRFKMLPAIKAVLGLGPDFLCSIVGEKKQRTGFRGVHVKPRHRVSVSGVESSRPESFWPAVSLAEVMGLTDPQKVFFERSYGVFHFYMEASMVQGRKMIPSGGFAGLAVSYVLWSAHHRGSRVVSLPEFLFSVDSVGGDTVEASRQLLAVLGLSLQSANLSGRKVVERSVVVADHVDVGMRGGVVVDGEAVLSKDFMSLVDYFWSHL